MTPALGRLPVVLRGPRRAEAASPRMALARLLPGFQEDAGSWRVALSLAEAATYRDVLFDLWTEAAALPGAELLVAGQATDLAGLKHALAVADCAATRAALPDPAGHCHPVTGWDWGCRFLAGVAPQADPEATLRAVLEAAATRHVRHCPHWDEGFARRQATTAAPSVSPAPAPRQEAPPRSPAPPAIPETHYTDIGGLDDAVHAVREAIELPLRHPEVLERLGIPPTKGVLLHGPPGCGKTLLARAVAWESGAHFIAVSGPELITKWHGESEDNLRQIFAEAQARQPSIVFFDEIDAIAQKRSAAESLRLDSRFTTQLLVLLDGIHHLGQVFVIGTTNRLDLLDPALLRPGRFDRIIAVPPPDAAGRRAILAIHTRRLPLAPDVHLDALAEELAGATGADLAFLVRAAAGACLRRTLGATLLTRPTPLSNEELARLTVTAADFETGLAELAHRTATLAAAS